ncbi:group I truncated hemoglobin [Natrialbaceae archaeon AArc-T1-2]|uniref:group I truncated hemoglobin n=1 Tax=Natrialbaceae archaeon AArc-T1-2 TaxID=3053904 RepID=UPI00255A9F94|nr:group 1 truncated hemoglobin [Natrialbaceae archaeon AArc-T1-2]WIV67602.1 group 1 truncated hemoglobin [Natrialbaceae archaeon AArc-T1-2]
MSQEPLYERLGGEDSIAAVVDAFYERVLEDDRVAHFFEDTDMQKQRAHQTQFLSAVAGGPVEYSGEDMESAHDDLEIRQKHFDAIAELLEEALLEFDVDDRERTDVLEAFASYEDDIVTS